MKTNNRLFILKYPFALSMMTGILISSQVSGINSPHYLAAAVLTGTNAEEHAKKGKLTSLISNKNEVVKIYLDVEKQTVLVFAKKSEHKEISFFVFDLDGTMIQNFKMKARERRKIHNMEKGTYIYRVFSGDEEAVSGTIEIK